MPTNRTTWNPSLSSVLDTHSKLRNVDKLSWSTLLHAILNSKFGPCMSYALTLAEGYVVTRSYLERKEKTPPKKRKKKKSMYILHVEIWRFGDELQSLLPQMRRNGECQLGQLSFGSSSKIHRVFIALAWVLTCIFNQDRNISTNGVWWFLSKVQMPWSTQIQMPICQNSWTRNMIQTALRGGLHHRPWTCPTEDALFHSMSSWSTFHGPSS